MGDRPPLPKHLVIYDKPNPQKYNHVVSGDEYEILGETFMEKDEVEGFIYRRTDPDHPATVTRAKTIFNERFVEGRYVES